MSEPKHEYVSGACVVCHGPVARTSHWARKTCSEACRSAARRAAGQVSAANLAPISHRSTKRHAPKRETPTADHPHHWIIATPCGGKTSPGRCKVCGAGREFPNATEGHYEFVYGKDPYELPVL